YLAGTQMLGAPVGVLAFSAIVSVGVGFAFAALPTLINAAVPVSETAAANGINSLARSLGTSTSSAVMSAILVQMTVVYAGHAIPSLTGFRTALLIAAGAAAAAALIAATIPTSTPAPAPAIAESVVAPSPVHRRAQRLENVMTALGRQAAVRLQIPSMPQRLDRGDYVTAAYLGGAGSMTLAELARALDSPTAPVEERLSVLIRDGLVGRMPTADHAAPPRFALTQNGRTIFERQRSTNIAGLESILSHWDDGDVAVLIGYLGRLADGIDMENRRQNTTGATPHEPLAHAYTAPIRTRRELVSQSAEGPPSGALRNRWR
ncbi:MAG: MFS transporter, partial [Candidatus Binatia bacterium]